MRGQTKKYFSLAQAPRLRGECRPAIAEARSSAGRLARRRSAGDQRRHFPTRPTGIGCAATDAIGTEAGAGDHFSYDIYYNIDS
jgi:hypothetical protein